MRYNIMIKQIIIDMFKHKHTSFHDFTNDTNQRYRTIILQQCGAVFFENWTDFSFLPIGRKDTAS
jgi:hypothetical protein